MGAITKSAVIAVVGGKKSGKTTTIELLTKELAKRGYRICVAKHVPEPNFTIDQEGKDTWRYAQAGAGTIVSVSADEIATIEKARSGEISLETILQKCQGSDLIFLEGFRDLVSNEDKIYKILVVKSEGDASIDMKVFHPIIALTGPFRPKRIMNIPYVDVRRNTKKLADLIEKDILKKSPA